MFGTWADSFWGCAGWLGLGLMDLGNIVWDFGVEQVGFER